MLQVKQMPAVAKTISLPNHSIRRKAEQDQIAISSNGKIDLIDTDQILYLKASSNYTEVHLKDGSSIVTSTTLKKYEGHLSIAKFIRVHNSYIIQQSEMKSFLHNQNLIVMQNAQKIPVSRSRRDELLKHLKRLMVCLAFIFSSNLVIAQFTQWEQGESSDWFINMNWNGPTNWSCDCLGSAQDGFIIFEVGDIENPIIDLTRAHNGSGWNGTNQWTVGPEASINLDAQMSVIGAFNNFINPCMNTCAPGYFGGQITATTEALRNLTNLQAIYNADGTATITWDVTTDAPDNLYFMQAFFDGQVVGNFNFKATESWTINCPQVGLYEFQTSIINPPNPFILSDFASIQVTEGFKSDGSISGVVQTLSGNFVPGVVIRATLINTEDFGNLCPFIFDSEPTQSNGAYSIPNIKYHNGSSIANAEYEFEAFLDGHQFRLSSDTTMSTVTFSFSNSNHVFNNVDFTDVTSYDLTGKVTVENNCGLEDVVLTATKPGNVPTNAISQGDGNYALILPEQGVYDIVASFGGIPFDTIEDVNVTDNLSGQNFFYAQQDTITGFVGAGCGEYIGEMTLEARTMSGCLIEVITTNLSGYYEMVLPRVPIEVQVISYNPLSSGLDAQTVLNDIDSIYMIDLDSTYTLDIQYRKPIELEIKGLPMPPCAAMTVPVLDQDRPVAIQINVWESLGICAADTGSVTITDDISTFGVQNPIITELPISNGIAEYLIMPGDPALGAPYHKTINITAFVDNQVKSVSFPVIVSGSRVRTSTLVTTPSDSIPYLILRDPPGDGSTAFSSSSNTTTYAQSFSHEVAGGLKLWASAKTGVEIFSVAIYGKIGASLEVGGSRKTNTETTVSMQSTQTISTSSQNAFIGENGDLIMGAAVNFKYGLSDDRIFDLNTCSMTIDTSLVFSPDTFSSTFIHSVKFIKENIIPKLEFLSQNPDTTEAARRKFANRLQTWEQMMQLNRDLKEEALKTPSNTYSVDNAANLSETSTSSSTKQASLEFTTTLDVNVAASAGVKGFGNEFEGGIELKMRNTWGGSSVESLSESTTIGYNYSDDDPGDAISFTQAIDSVYGTPVFKVLGGETSCPHEENTQFIDLVKLTIPDPVFVGQPGEDFADFAFTLQNLGETPVSNLYFIDLVDQSNAQGAIITLNGSQIFDPGVLFTLFSGQTIGGNIRLTRPPGNQYAFEGLEFEAFAACFASGNPFPDKTFKSTAFISAYFSNDCSNIDLTSPSEGFLINQPSNNTIMVTMDQYNLGLGDIDEVRLMYSKAGESSWNESNVVIPGANLLPPPQSYAWDVSGLEDGLYSIRWELNCGPTINFSQRVQGQIERSIPRVYGVEKPVTDLYAPGSEISVQFNEEIDFSGLLNSNVYLKLLPQNSYISAQIMGAVDELIVVPNEDISMMYNQAFEAGVFGISDMFGNVRMDTTTWEFVVSEPDSDRDGIPDTEDRCPGGDDYIDSDADGLPDDCDCLPLIAANGRSLTKAAIDFDGIDDHITIPLIFGADPNDNQSLTIEAWIKYDSTSDFNTIVSKGDALGSSSYIMNIFQGQLAMNFGAAGGGTTWFYSDSLLTPNRWMHVAVSYNHMDGSVSFFYNGKLIKNESVGFSLNTTFGPILIGRQGVVCNCNFFKGQMDDIRFWNVARTESEIQEKMNQELIVDEANVLAYYSLNEGSPFGDNTDLINIIDMSINNNNGGLVNFDRAGAHSNWVYSSVAELNVAYLPCKNCPDTANVALDFDGFNDHLEIADQPVFDISNNTSFAFEAWVYPKNTENSQTILSKGHGGNTNTSYIFSIFQGKVSIFIGNGIGSGQWFSGNSDVPVNTWSHLVVSYNHIEQRFSFYLDGELDGSAFWTFGFYDDASPVYIGRQGQTCNCNFFKGQMDDVRMWNTERTTEEIQNGIFAEMYGDESGLIAYYNFNESLPEGDNTASMMITDASGNGHNATLVEFANTGMISNAVVSPLYFPDMDGDGMSDVCDDCFATRDLVLENMTIDGIYRAEEKIILGNGVTIPANANLEFRAPFVQVSEYIQAPASAIIIVAPRPCEE